MGTPLITKKRIAKSFKQLFLTQEFEKISVQKIMAGAGIRRQTFYNHFLDKYQLLEWIFQTDLKEQITDNLEYISGWQLLEELLTFFLRNKTFYRKAFEIVDQNNFTSYFEYYAKQLITKLDAEYGQRTFSSEDAYNFYIHYHSQALVSSIKHLLTLQDTDYHREMIFLTQLLKNNITKKELL
ncbi:dihydroxyacetone kinase transcriptional activator DhaS [Streptococcus massiliensis]|uniref:Putative dihydroxyacetone kinase regulator n=1 Tax=Streptococcus massiliensis TaxID=313439 RepID=A0A380L009_9STRE|nr:dihydroxyacetone kinase transcriptional activator DhaS [Streptococcus massiliensis]SUN76889.1 putative dihydroxyacetone kinase regulator [Streptococcus massiliensis]